MQRFLLKNRCLYPRELWVRLLLPVCSLASFPPLHFLLLLLMSGPRKCFKSPLCLWWIKHGSDSTNTRFMTAFPFLELMKVFPRFSRARRATFALGAVKISRWSLGNRKKKSRGQTNRLNLIFSVERLMQHYSYILISYVQSCLFGYSLVQSCEHCQDKHRRCIGSGASSLRCDL